MEQTLSKQKCFLIVACFAVLIHFLIRDWFGGSSLPSAWQFWAVSGGWLLVARANANLWLAALAGVVMLTVDHVLLNGRWFLIAQIF